MSPPEKEEAPLAGGAPNHHQNGLSIHTPETESVKQRRERIVPSAPSVRAPGTAEVFSAAEHFKGYQDKCEQEKTTAFSKPFIARAADRGISPEALEEEWNAAVQQQEERLKAEEKIFYDLFAEWFDLLYEPVTYIACIKGSTGVRNPWNSDEKGIWLDKDNWYDLEYSDNPVNLKLAIAEGGNVAIRLGALSNNIFCIDIDADKNVAPFVEKLPAFENTLSRRGSKGRQFYCYIEGDYPQTIQKLIIDGSDVNGGELRGEGLSFIWGQHHKQVDPPIRYHWVNKVRPIRIKYDEIVKGITELGWEIMTKPEPTKPPTSCIKKSSSKSFKHSFNGAHHEGRPIDWKRFN